MGLNTTLERAGRHPSHGSTPRSLQAERLDAMQRFRECEVGFAELLGAAETEIDLEVPGNLRLGVAPEERREGVGVPFPGGCARCPRRGQSEQVFRRARGSPREISRKRAAGEGECPVWFPAQCADIMSADLEARQENL